jgi:hypothetical protein
MPELGSLARAAKNREKLARVLSAIDEIERNLDLLDSELSATGSADVRWLLRGMRDHERELRVRLGQRSARRPPDGDAA